MNRRHPVLAQSRSGRAVGAVAAAMATTAGGHLIATGHPPPPPGLLLALVLMAVPAWWLTGDERGWERLAGFQLAAQIGGHALFVLTATDPTAHAAHQPTGPDLVLLFHVFGAAVAAAWLRAGERRAVMAAHRAVEALRRLVSCLLRNWRPVRRLRASAFLARAAECRVVVTRLRHSIVHRGPPAVC
ncbi:hypothetical protein [Pseudonocardia sp. DLS-67]